MKKFSRYIEEMSMSVTLKPKKNNMYKVTGVGKKMAAHGGIKKGEKFHDSEIDGMHDSGIKVKYEKPKAMKKEAMMPGEGKATVKDKKLRMQRTMDKHGVLQQKPPIKGKLGKITKIGEAMDIHHGEDPFDATPKAELENERSKRLKAMMKKKPPVKPNMKLKKESIQRRMDRMTIIATDPATGRKVVKVAPKKEIDIGKGKMESAVNEISDTAKKNYIRAAGKDVSYLEKQKMKPANKQVNNVRMDRDSAPFYKDVNKKNIDKEILKRRKGMRMATGKLGEGAFKEMDTIKKENERLKKQKEKQMNQKPVQELKISTMDKYKRKAYGDIQTGENARHKGYPEKDIDKRQDKRYKGIDTANKRIAKKQVKMAKGVAFDKRYKGGNMTGATKAIDKIKPGLSNHPKVKDALRRANESKGE